MKKKLLAFALSAIMLLGIGTTAFAEESTTLTDTESVTITKTLTATGLEDTDFTFTITDAAGSPTDTSSSVTANPSLTDGTNPITGFTITVDEGETTGTYTIALPTYTSVGVYTYVITETKGSVAGVTYSETPLYLVVTVTNGATKGEFIRTVAVHSGSVAGSKTDVDVENTYEAATLEIKKTVTGNLGDKTKDFTVTVTFDANGLTVDSTISYTDDGVTETIAPTDWTDGTYTATITVRDGETVAFTNVPYGITYSVSENDYTTATNGSYDAAAYSVSDGNAGSASTATVTANEVDNAVEHVDITNNKGADVDTGINLDTLPYIAILGVVVVMGGAFLISKRRLNNSI